MWRVFCAIEIPSDTRQRIAEHTEQLRHALPDVQPSWTKPENIHLTLKFFGNISRHQVLKASEAASRAATCVGPLTLHVGQPGAFPARGPAKVIWIGINDPTGDLFKLYQTLEEQCALEGFAREERAFHPHLTVARLRHPRGARMLAEKHKEMGFESNEIVVSNLILLRSELNPKGSNYTVVSEHPLAG